MDIVDEPLAEEASPFKSLERALEREVACAKPNKLEADFREAYPLLEQSLARKVTRKVVIKNFNAAYGHKLYPPAFRDLLLAERNRRCKSGVELTGPCSGHLLPTIDEAGYDDGAHVE